MKNLQYKISDYIRFGQVLLALSTIFMVGLLLPNGEKQSIQFAVMIGAIITFLGTSFFFFYRAKKLREKVDEMECEETR
ncbi:YrhC family protein [Microbacteriaceae bacterium 4G12]